MAKIKVDRSGIIHAYAQCQICAWADSIDIKKINRMAALRNSIIKHVRETGREVVLETGNSTYYNLDK